MAEKKKADDQKAAPGPTENKALTTADPGPVTATTEQGAEQARTASEDRPKLAKAEEKRLQDLRESGYRIPREWAEGEKETIEHDKRIAKAMPSTRDQEHKS